MKSFGVRFYTANSSTDAPSTIVADTLQILYDKSQREGMPHQIQGEDGCRYEIRELQPLGGGASFRGVLAVVRDDAPHIRAADGAEREIHLEDQEGVLEKNYFLFFRKHRLLVWQVNGRASHVMRFERYLSSLSPHSIAFDHVIDRNAMDRLRSGAITRIRVQVAMSKNAQAYDPHVWEGGIFQTMAGAGASTMQFELSTGRKKTGLTAAVKDAIHRLLDRAETRSIKVRMDGQQEFIDLVADCVTDKIQVNMIGLYPDPTDVFAQLAAAKDRQTVRLEAYYGTGDRVLE